MKYKKDDGLDGDNDVKNTLPSHLRAFILSKNKRNKNNIIREITGFYNNISSYYGDTDSLYMETKFCVVINKAILVDKIFCRSTNDYESGGIFHGLFLAPKINYCLTFIEFSILEEHKTFKSFRDSKRLLDRAQCFKLIEGKKTIS